MNKIKSIALSFICILAVNTSADAAGKPVKALDAFSWSAAEWISAANAPVMDLVVNDTQNCPERTFATEHTLDIARRHHLVAPPSWSHLGRKYIDRPCVFLEDIGHIVCK